MFFTLQEGTSNKRFKAVFYNRNKKIKTVQFGDRRYENYTIHKDKKRKELYRKRHHKDNIQDPMTAGALSWWLLWNKETLKESIEDFEDKFCIIYTTNI
jgi:hypothetical protein